VLQTKAIDGAAVSEPFIVQYQDRKLAFPYLRASEVLVKSRLETAVMIYNLDWMRSHPEQAKGFAVAYLNGARDYLDMTRGGSKRKEAIDIIVIATSLPTPWAGWGA
jgi:ABC-type nitrate/sulfonate/bicarbonate transport system substrate-binding protein